YCSSLIKGGTERVVVNLAEYLHHRGIDVVIVTQYKLENEYVLSTGIPRIYSEITETEKKNNRVGDFFARYGKLRKIWKSQKPDCIVSFIGKNNIMAVGAALFTGIPVLVSVRAEPKCEYNSLGLKFFSRTLFYFAAGVIVQTKEARKFFPAYIRKKAVILKNPLNPSFIRPRFEGKRDGRIVAVGRVDSNKNHEMIIRAFDKIADEFPDTSLVIYGEGECRERLQKLVEELGLSKRVSLPGSVTDISDKIYQSSIFVLSSDSEGMPNALLEAMSLGIPCISTDCPCGGPKELIKDGENGFLIPIGDVDALTDRLRMLFSDEEMAERIGKQAAKLAELYSPDKVNDEWLTYLSSKMGGN
ncbi:MAG: glycosyltransferase family 4 protein, partial [Butyrivibrio sp.]|nr:glycosyltransferase family 4 protein [Butyrivibrio sp.]